MFQNLTGTYRDGIEEEDVETSKKQTSKQFVKKIFTKQTILLYILSFMISTVGFGQNITPFAIAILASCCSNRIPMGVTFLITCLGTLVGLGKENLLIYLLTSLLFMALVLFKRPKISEIEHRKKVGFHLAISCIIVELGKMAFGPFLIYDLLTGILFTICACIFYKIFSSSLSVIYEFDSKKAFSIEEVIGASLILALAVAGFKDLSIFGFSIRNILSILIVLIMGWQNGMVVGATSGITIGVVLGIIGSHDPIQLAAYALSGMLAGLFNRLGKIGVVVGFVLGSGILAYVANGNTSNVILVQEILIASIGLLAVPNRIRINIEDLYGKTKFLPVTTANRLEPSQDAVQKLNSVSEALSEVAQTYKEAAATVVEEKTKQEDKNKEAFLDEFQNHLPELENNILFDELQENTSLLEDFYDTLANKEYIVEKDIITILEKHNQYLVGAEEEKIDASMQEELRQVVKACNSAYRTSQINFVWEKKMDEKKKTMGTQIEGISKTISSIAETISETKTADPKEQELLELLRQKEIPAGEVHIKKEKNGKNIITIYLDACQKEKIEECHAEKIQKLLTKQLGQTMLLQKEDCPIRSKRKVCTLIFSSEDNYKMQLGMAKTTKAGSSISGDSDLEIKLQDGKYLLAISDGMGSGPEARKSSQIAIKMLKRLLSSGFDKETSVELINSSLCLNAKDDMYATLDTAILDLYQGNVEFIKNGACPTYLKHHKQVDIMKELSLPAGILGEIELNVYDRDLEDGDILIMCSDGIIEANREYENKELWVKYLLEEIETDNVQKIADILLQEAIDHNFGMAKDDMTVLVAKIVKK